MSFLNIFKSKQPIIKKELPESQKTLIKCLMNGGGDYGYRISADKKELFFENYKVIMLKPKDKQHSPTFIISENGEFVKDQVHIDDMYEYDHHLVSYIKDRLEGLLIDFNTIVKKELSEEVYELRNE
jgi:hypothetical protein